MDPQYPRRLAEAAGERRVLKGRIAIGWRCFPSAWMAWIDEDDADVRVDRQPSWIRSTWVSSGSTVSCPRRPAGLSSRGPAQALHLRLPEPGTVEPTAGAGGAAQRRGDVADWAARIPITRPSRTSARTMAAPSARSAHASSRCAARWASWPPPVVAIDGSKFKAVNNRDRNFTRAERWRGGGPRSRRASRASCSSSTPPTGRSPPRRSRPRSPG